jgi:hypothetical protein
MGLVAKAQESLTQYTGTRPYSKSNCVRHMHARQKNKIV